MRGKKHLRIVTVRGEGINVGDKSRETPRSTMMEEREVL